MNLKQQVKTILKEIPETRNSDIRLMIEIWKRYYPQKIYNFRSKEFVSLDDLYDLPRDDNVKRLRASFAERALKRIFEERTKGDEHYYLPTSKQVAIRRKMNEEDWQRALGYFKRTARAQRDQLPKPIGNVNIREVNMGVGGTKFLLYDDGTSREVDVDLSGKWSCNCGQENCGHIKLIKAIKK